MTATWFLDIDGVINSETPKPHHVERFGVFDVADVGVPKVYRIDYRQSVVDFINEMSRSGLANIVWLTSWQKTAATEFAPGVGLDKFPFRVYSGGSENPSDMDWWKWLIVKDFADHSDDPFVWTDDDLGGNVKRDAKHYFGDRMLALTPMPAPGLEPDHLDRIREFLLAHQ